MHAALLSCAAAAAAAFYAVGVLSVQDWAEWLLNDF